MAITIGPDGELIKTVSSNSSRFSMPVPTQEQIGALSFTNEINPKFEGVEEYKKNVLDSDGNFVPQLDDDGNALLDDDGNALFETTDESRRYVSLPKIGYNYSLPDQAMAQNLYGTKYMPHYQHSAPKEIGRNVYYPDEENLMSQGNIQPIVGGDSDNADKPPSFDQAAAEQAGQVIAGMQGASIGGAIGAAVAAGMTGNESFAAGLSALDPFDGIGLETGKKTASKMALDKNIGKITGNAEGPATFTERLSFGTEAGKANWKQQAFTATGDALVQIAAGADPIVAIRRAGSTAVITAIANAINPTYGYIAGMAKRFADAAGLEIDLNQKLFGWDGKF
tara:strand:+ start:934 stop:1947 length:1014 start_codon:yes stop_codon:yes gene_type:complete